MCDLIWASWQSQFPEQELRPWWVEWLDQSQLLLNAWGWTQTMSWRLKPTISHLTRNTASQSPSGWCKGRGRTLSLDKISYPLSLIPYPLTLSLLIHLLLQGKIRGTSFSDVKSSLSPTPPVNRKTLSFHDPHLERYWTHKTQMFDLTMTSRPEGQTHPWEGGDLYMFTANSPTRPAHAPVHWPPTSTYYSATWTGLNHQASLHPI